MVHTHRKFESRETLSEKGSQREGLGRISPELSTGAYALLLLLPFVAAGLSSECVNAQAFRSSSALNSGLSQMRFGRSACFGSNAIGRART
jgi:hypothetical protein